MSQELNKTMYFRANKNTMDTARILRKKMTYSENILWEKLRGKQICGVRFRRQHPIEFYIADFYCHKARLVIELDGEIHIQQAEYDDGRSAEFEKYGIKVIRFENTQVINSLDNVVSEIIEIVTDRLKNATWFQ